MAAHRSFRLLVAFACLLLLVPAHLATAGDKCIFSVTADKVPPNIIILLDNGADMEQVDWHRAYDPAIDYTPPGGSIFVNPHGYAANIKNNAHTLIPIRADLSVNDSDPGLIPAVVLATGVNPTPANTISVTVGEKTVHLPKVPSSSVDSEGVKDGATRFRYASNYLNWLFYSGLYDGGSLSQKTRLYWAKHAILKAAENTNNQARFGVMAFTNTEGASSVQPVGFVVTAGTLTSAFVNNINNMGTVTYSPLAEGLASVGGQYAGKNLSQEISEFYCQKNFALVVTSGMSSMDQTGASQSSPSRLEDFDGDGAAGGLGEGKLKVIHRDGTPETITIPVNLADAATVSNRGSTYLDDVAWWLHNNDVIGYRPGFQNVNTFTVGVMPNFGANAFLVNTSNNGNGIEAIYDRRDPDTFRYHYVAESPEGISEAITAALKNILERTSTFTAPVVPVTRTTSGDLIYLAFFKPLSGSNMWEGNITKFGLNSSNEIVSYPSGSSATWPNGAMRDEATPYWGTIKWARSEEPNYVLHSARRIFTYLGDSQVTSATNAFTVSNTGLTSAMLGVGTSLLRQNVIEFVRGKAKESNDNRRIIHGDSLHSEPAIISWANGTRYIFFGANDGMLHAVNDVAGTEAWSFIPPDQLPRLQAMVLGESHEYYIDSSPRVVIVGGNRDHVVDPGERAILVVGERKGGRSYFALDVTTPADPRLLWRLSGRDDSPEGIASPSVSSSLGQSWSEPVFGKVKTSDGDTAGTQVMFIGGGYTDNNSAGKAVLVVDVTNGNIVRTISLGNFSAPANVTVVDANNNGFIDKAYIGDMGGQLWRIGKFTDGAGQPLPFPQVDENVSSWTAQLLFSSGGSRKIFYSIDIALEYGYDLLLFGTGNRENPCEGSDGDRIYAIKDTHVNGSLTESNLTNISNATAILDGANASMGWYYPLQAQEKILSEGTLFYGVFYVTSFIPRSDDPCKPGGDAILYGLKYKTGGAGLKVGGTTVTQTTIGGGIGSKPIVVIREDSQTLLVSVGSTNAVGDSESTGAGVTEFDPTAPTQNLFLMWWQEIFN